jgi:hypothetical protein
MDELFGYIARAVGGVARALRWTLETVDVAPPMRLAPPPGPAHGPVSAIDVRLGNRLAKDRRRN